MLRASPQVLAHLARACQQERDRLASIEEEVGENWPDGFDANDIPLYDVLVNLLIDAVEANQQELDLFGKPLNFVLLALPEYVQTHRDNIGSAEYQVLKTLYFTERPAWSGAAREFPD